MRAYSVLLLVVFAFSEASADIFSISALNGTGQTRRLDSGKYSLLPIGGAWTPWDEHGCEHGSANCWVYSYGVESSEVGFKWGGAPGVYLTPTGAFNAAKSSSLVLNLTYAQNVKFYIPDDPYEDNSGSITLKLVEMPPDLSFSAAERNWFRERGDFYAVAGFLGTVGGCVSSALGCLVSGTIEIAPDLANYGYGTEFGAGHKLALSLAATAVGVIAAGPSLTVGGALLAASSAIGAFQSYKANTFYRLASDPPDMRYDEVVSVEVSDFFWEFGLGTEFDSAFAQMFNDSAYSGLVLEAALTSYERWQAAVLMEDTDAAVVQYEAYDMFYDLIGSSRTAAAQSLENLAILFAEHGAGEIVFATDFLTTLIEDLSENGLSHDVSALFASGFIPYGGEEFLLWLSSIPIDAFSSGQSYIDNFHALSFDLRIPQPIPLPTSAICVVLPLLLLRRFAMRRAD